MSETRLTDAELADVLEHVECHHAAGQPGVYMEYAELDALLTEVRAARAHALDDNERAILRRIRAYLDGVQFAAWSTEAVAVLDKLLAAKDTP